MVKKFSTLRILFSSVANSSCPCNTALENIKQSKAISDIINNCKGIIWLSKFIIAKDTWTCWVYKFDNAWFMSLITELNYSSQ